MASSDLGPAIREELRTLPGRVQSFIRTLPLITFMVPVATLSLWLVDAVASFAGYSHLTGDALGLLPNSVTHGQLWRLATYPWAHFGFFHVALNAIGLVGLSASAERRVGSLQFLYLLVVVFSALPGILFFVVATLVVRSLNFHLISGLSGWIMALLAWECCRVDAPRSFFGLFQVSSKVFPVVFLCLMELIFPHSSFFGHLVAMVVGYLYAYGKLDRIVPASQTMAQWQNKPLMNGLTASPRFIDINDASDTGLFLPNFFSRSGPSATTGAEAASQDQYVTIPDSTSPPQNPTNPPAQKFPGKGNRLDNN
ncbi:Tryptase beta-2 [Dimargaris verticillata]|uniref:rhomboid protease n=1 Tax=Dimargaris verticillata TaxID=2761393 RepID=A0A9W8B3I6_9FUNG|nr:Tryptase beta-2 [Dimargaris verticillata]